jgi:SAM-dependent methyltransferase
MLGQTLQALSCGRRGVEIGGPSGSGRILYASAATIDNVIFSRETVWSTHDSGTYRYFEGKTGRVIIHDAVDISSVASGTYDFLFASHSLEHIANPLKALKEWIRITVTGGHIVLILPEKSQCFDHRRRVSEFSTLLSQYNAGVGEDDLSTLPEILANHDLSMDRAAGTPEQFRARSLENYKNRCLHHYVYSPALLRTICQYLGCEFVGTETHGLDIWFVMRTPAAPATAPATAPALAPAAAPAAAPSKAKTLVLYVFHEYNDRVTSFFKHALFEDPAVDFIVIVNNKAIEVSVPSYVRVLKRDNVGYDFGGWSDGLLTDGLYKNYESFIFVNSSVVGPFLKGGGRWTDLYLGGLTGNIKLFGSTINTCMQPLIYSHVQSYIFALRRTALEHLISCGIFSMTDYVATMEDAIHKREVRMSRRIIERGWNIGSLMSYYKGIDFTFSFKQPEACRKVFLDDPVMPPYYRRLWDEYQLVFVKGNRGFEVLALPGVRDLEQ